MMTYDGLTISTVDGWILIDGQLVMADARVAKIIEAMQSEVEKLKQQANIPGELKCAKCDFVLIKTSLNVSLGSMTADNSPDNCLNCDVPMWRVSWKGRAEESMNLVEEQSLKMQTLQAEIEKLKAELKTANQTALDRKTYIDGVWAKISGAKMSDW